MPTGDSMPEGPLGGPRPFAEYRLLIDPHEPSVQLLKVGPLGGPRPLAKNNPPVDDERIRECILSDAGRSFGAGVVSNGATTNIADLDQEQTEEALRVTEKWCEGLLEASALEGADQEEIDEQFESLKETLGVEEVIVRN